MDRAERLALTRQLVDALPVGVFSATMSGEILEANPAFASLFGLFDPEEVAWSSFPGLFAAPEAAAYWRAQIESARFVGSLDCALKRSDGGQFRARVWSWVVEDAPSGVRHSHVNSAVGYGGASDIRVHFGLGKDETVTKLEVRWPSGTVQVLENVASNQVLEVKEPEK